MRDYIFLGLHGSAMPIKVTNTDHMDVDQIISAIDKGWTIFYKITSKQSSFFTSIFKYGEKYFVCLYRQEPGSEPDNTFNTEFNAEEFRLTINEYAPIIRERGQAVKILRQS